MNDPLALIQSKLRTSSQRALAAELGISPGYLGDIVAKRRPPSDKVLSALGIEIVYRRKRNG